MKNNVAFRRFGIMLDNSRNAVMKPEAVKKLIDIISKMGYNTLMLYTEDTYEVDNQPYFGHLRGRYSKTELKEIDAYAASRGVELIPCIQTLAHLNAIMRWPQYNSIRDCEDILCAGEDGVYALLEDIFSTLDQCFTSRIVNIGMDEAHFIGRGKYLDKHGLQDRFDILLTHLKRVSDIARKYGFELCMWDDMLFRLATGGDYYCEHVSLPPEIKERIPDNVRPIYWDYYSTEKDHYDRLIPSHKAIMEDIWFAGGAWTWSGFAPHNFFSLKANLAAISSCAEHGVKDVFLTVWGDNGAECSRFGILPTLFAASQFAQGNTDSDDIAKKFEEMFGIKFNDFLLVDLPETPNVKNPVSNPDKYMLYNDCLMGMFDGNVSAGDGAAYGKCAENLKALCNNSDFGKIFKSLYHLCRVLEIKCDIGIRTRKAYHEKSIEDIKKIIADYDELLIRINDFYNAHLERWSWENKPHGFDVQDIRLGGLIKRVEHCRAVLSDFANGKCDRIEELEEPVLDVHGGIELTEKPICCNNWQGIVTANVI